MGEDNGKYMVSALIGVAGFLASHAFARLEKKGDKQEDLGTKIQLIEARLIRLEQDLQEFKKLLYSLLKARHRESDEEDSDES